MFGQMLLKIYPENPSLRQIRTVVDTFNEGGVVIFPTDTVYGMGCSIRHPKAFDRIALIKGLRKEKANFSFMFHNLSQLSEFTRPLNNEVFKLMKRNLPGPFTFIVEANNNVPKLFQNKKRTLGIRIPDEPVIQAILAELGQPIMTTSILDDDKILEYTTDPEVIYEKFRDKVDIVIDAGYGGNQPSTIVDCTGDEPLVLRQGKGQLI